MAPQLKLKPLPFSRLCLFNEWKWFGILSLSYYWNINPSVIKHFKNSICLILCVSKQNCVINKLICQWAWIQSYTCSLLNDIMLNIKQRPLPHSGPKWAEKWGQDMLHKEGQTDCSTLYWSAAILPALPWTNVTGELTVCTGNWICRWSHMGKQGKGL